MRLSAAYVSYWRQKWLSPSSSVTQWWLFVSENLGNKFQWSVIHKTIIRCQWYAFQNIICKPTWPGPMICGRAFPGVSHTQWQSLDSIHINEDFCGHRVLDVILHTTPKHENCHKGNFIATGRVKIVLMTFSVAANDNKVGMMNFVLFRVTNVVIYCPSIFIIINTSA